MVSLARLTRKKLGEILVEQGLISEQQVQDALRQQHQQGILFGEALVEQGLITEDKMVSVLIDQFGIPYIDPTKYAISDDLLEIFDPAMMRRFQFVPLDMVGSVLVVAIAGLLSEDLLLSMEQETGCTIHLYLTRMNSIRKVLDDRGIG
jgi:type IV pilus assembly protein PilB